MSLLSVSHLRKSYGGAVALRTLRSKLRAGETLALIGENGAGKSTLIKVLAGALAPDGGGIELAGAPFDVPRAPQRRIGAGSVSSIRNSTSSRALASPKTSFSAAPIPPLRHRRLAGAQREGAFSARRSRRGPHRRQDDHGAGFRSATACWSRSPRPFSKTRAGAGAHFRNGRADRGVDGRRIRALFRIIDCCETRGCGISHVSHRLDEVLSIADRITVLRDGETRATLTANEATKTKLIELMTGRKAAETVAAPAAPASSGSSLSAVEGLNARRAARHFVRTAQGRDSRFRRPRHAGAER